MSCWPAWCCFCSIGPNHSPTQELAPLEHAPLPVNYCELLCRTRHFDYAAIVAAWSLYLAFAAQPAANMG